MNIISTLCDQYDLIALYGQWEFLNVSHNIHITILFA